MAPMDRCIDESEHAEKQDFSGWPERPACDSTVITTLRLWSLVEKTWLIYDGGWERR